MIYYGLFSNERDVTKSINHQYKVGVVYINKGLFFWHLKYDFVLG